jgi:hypothetical protein
MTLPSAGLADKSGVYGGWVILPAVFKRGGLILKKIVVNLFLTLSTLCIFAIGCYKAGSGNLTATPGDNPAYEQGAGKVIDSANKQDAGKIANPVYSDNTANGVSGDTKAQDNIPKTVPPEPLPEIDKSMLIHRVPNCLV